jgi:hypothetical protein
LQEIIRCYGDIRVDKGAIVDPKDWESQNMGMYHEPWMPRGKLYVNRKAWPMLKAAIEACLAIGDGYQIKTLGCFAPRNKRVNGDLSTHSWGISVDINADSNPLAATVGAPLVTDLPDTWVATIESIGWNWGGRWKRPDAMHFQFASGY